MKLSCIGATQLLSRASAGIKASLDAAATERFDGRLAAMLKADFPEDPMRVPHRVWWVSGRKGS